MVIYRKKINSIGQMKVIIKKLSKQKKISQQRLRHGARINGDSVLIIKY